MPMIYACKMRNIVNIMHPVRPSEYVVTSLEETLRQAVSAMRFKTSPGPDLVPAEARKSME